MRKTAQSAIPHPPHLNVASRETSSTDLVASIPSFRNNKKCENRPWTPQVQSENETVRKPSRLEGSGNHDECNLGYRSNHTVKKPVVIGTVDIDLMILVAEGQEDYTEEDKAG